MYHDNRYSQKIEWLKVFLSHVDPLVRNLAARLIGIAFKSMSKVKGEELMESLIGKMEGSSQGKLFDSKDGAINGSGRKRRKPEVHFSFNQLQHN